MIHDVHLERRISLLEQGAIIVVNSEAQRMEAERIIHANRPFDDITVRVELPEDYDGERFIIDLSDFSRPSSRAHPLPAGARLSRRDPHQHPIGPAHPPPGQTPPEGFALFLPLAKACEQSL